MFIIRKNFYQIKVIKMMKNYSDSNGIRTHNHLVRKGKLNHLAKPVK